MEKRTKRLLAFLLSLVMVLGLMPWTGMTAYADTTNTAGKVIKVGEVYNVGDYITFNAAPPFTYVRYDDDTSSSYVSYLTAGQTTVTTPTYATRDGQWKFDSVLMYDPWASARPLRITGPSGVTPIGFKCSGGTGTQADPFTFEAIYPVTDVTLDKSSVALAIGAAETLTATVLPENAMDKTITWPSSNTSVATVSEAGVVTAVSTGTANIIATSNADNTKSATCAVTVSKPAASVTTPVESVTTEYNGQAQKLANGGVYSGGTMQYALGENADTAPTSGWTEAVPTATDAGTYYVWHKVAGDANHSDSAPVALTSTITPRTTTVSGLTVYQKYYDGTTNATLRTTAANFGNTVGNDKKSLTVSGDAVFADPNVGSGKTVNVTNLTLGGDMAKNYVLSSTNATLTGTINKIYVKVTAQDQTVPLNGSVDTSVSKAVLAAGANEPVNGHMLSAITLTASSTENATTDGTITPSEAVIQDSEGNDVTANYGFSYKKGKLTVTKIDPAYTVPTGLTAIYGDTLADVALPDGWAWVDSGQSVGNVDTKAFKANFTPEDTANYNTVSNVDVDVTVMKADPTVTAPKAKGLTSTDKAQALVEAGKAEGGTMLYSLDQKTWSATVPTATEPGTYTVWYKVTGDENHNDTDPASVKATIVKSVPDTPSVSYGAHVQGEGDVPAVKDGSTAGTTGQAKRLEAVSAKLSEGTIEYRSHVQGKGWEKAWAKDGAQSGTTGQAKRLEAIQMRLDDELSKDFSVWYRVHSQTYGWMGWAKDSEPAGTAGLAKRLEAYEVVVLPKGQTPSGYDATKAAFRSQVQGRAHVQSIGWTAVAGAGTLGTTGRGKRVEALSLTVPAALTDVYAGGISYQVHAQKLGWMAAKADGAVAGTTGEARRLEAVRISLTGKLAEHFSVWYRVHSQTFGWGGWAHDGADAGSGGYAKRAEAVEVVVLPKGAAAPGSTANAFRSK